MVLVTPGSSKNNGAMGVEEKVIWWLAREVLRRFRILAAIVLNLSRRKTF